MNDRPSTTLTSITSIFSIKSLEGERSVRSLRSRLVGIVGLGALVVLGIIGYAGLFFLQRSMADDENARISNAAALSGQLIDRLLGERVRQVDLIAAAPQVIASSRRGLEESRRLGLPAQLGNTLAEDVLETIETRFKATRSLQVDSTTLRYLRGLLPKLDIVEVMLTDQYGYNAVTTSPSSDFVQSDEGWWQTAWHNGSTTAQATADPATQRTVVELSRVVMDGATRVGVVKVKFGLSMVDSALAQGSIGGNALRVDLVDSAGKVIASSVRGTRFRPFAGFAAAVAQNQPGTFKYGADSTAQRAAVSSTNGGRWRVVAHMSEGDASHTYNVARWSLFAGGAVMLALIMLSLFFIARFVERRITGPAQDLATAAEAVAGGDLSSQMIEIDSDDEIGRLARAIGAMIGELRRLATALKESAADTASMTEEITGSSEEMAASAGQIAHTASDLSQQANAMAQTIQTLAASSERLVVVASELDSGAREGVDRNAQLRALALENRGRLDESSKSLATLSGDVEASASAIEQLAQASEEVRSFVTLVQKLARQSKLLALNAAMEAARAGEHGHGFAVVAEEVRRLASMSAEAAERTDHVVSGVLHGIAQSRSSSERSVGTVRAVRAATEEGSRSFGEIEKAVADADTWTSSIQQTSTAASGLVKDMRSKLDSLATGTEAFAAAMQEVAASSEEQSASTEEIAAAAATLAGAAVRLGRLVSNLRLEDVTKTGDNAQSGEPARAPASATMGRVTPLHVAAMTKV